MRLAFEERYRYFREALNEIPGVDCPACDGAFYAFPSFQGVLEARPDLSSDVDLANWLLEEAGVSTVPGSAFGAPGHLRLSYAASREYLEDAVGRIRKAVGKG
jgi:aspartate aminotransferase